MDLFDLFAKIELDTDDYDKGISDVQSGAKDAENSIEGIGDSADSAENDLDSLGSDASSAGSDLDSLGSDADSAGSDLDALGSDADAAGNDLDSLSSSADGISGSLDDIGSAASGASGSLGELGGEMSGDLSSSSETASGALGGVSDIIEMFATGGIIAGSVAAIGEVSQALFDLALEAEESTATIAQGTGATGEELEELAQTARDSLGDVSLSSKTNLGDVSETLAELNTRFGLTGDELEDCTSTMQDFASVTGQNGAKAVDKIADVMSYWGMETEEMPGLLDDVMTASQGTKASAEDLENALYKNSGQFQSLGYSVEDATAFLAMYADNGGDVTEVNKILKGAISNLSGEVEDVPGAFQQAIDAIEDCDNTADALSAQVGDTGKTVEEVFGKNAAQALAQNIQSGTSSVEEWTEALENNDGILQQTVEDSTTMQDSISSDMQRIKSDVSEIFTPAAEAVVGGAADMLDGILDFAENSSQKFSEWNANATEALYEKFGTTTEQVQEAVSNLDFNIGEAFSSMGETISGWGEQVSEGFNELVGDVGEFAVSFADGAMQAASDFITSLGDGILGGIEDVIQKVEELGSGIINAVKGFFGIGGKGDAEAEGEEISDQVGQGIANKDTGQYTEEQASKVSNKFSSWFGKGGKGDAEAQGENIVEGLGEGIKNSSSAESAMESQSNGILGSLQNFFGMHSPSTLMSDQGGNIIAGLANGITGKSSDAQSSMSDVGKGIIKGIDSLPTDVNKVLTNTTTKMSSWFKDIGSKSSSGAKDFLSNFTKGINSLPSDTNSTLSKVTENVKSFTSTVSNSMQTAGSKASDGFTKGINGLPNSAKNVMNSTKSSLTSIDMSGSLYNTGVNAMNGFINGMNSRAGSVYATANTIANNAYWTIQNALQIGSPSKKTRYLGEMTGEGFALGIESSMGEVQDAMDDLAELTDLDANGSISPDVNLSTTSTVESSLAGEIESFNANFAQLFMILNQYFPQFANNDIYLDTGALVGGTAKQMDRALGNISSRKARGAA